MMLCGPQSKWGTPQEASNLLHRQQIRDFYFYYMFYKEKSLHDSKLTVPANTTGENYTGTPDLIPIIFSNGSKI